MFLDKSNMCTYNCCIVSYKTYEVCNMNKFSEEVKKYIPSSEWKEIITKWEKNIPDIKEHIVFISGKNSYDTSRFVDRLKYYNIPFTTDLFSAINPREEKPKAHFTFLPEYYSLTEWPSVDYTLSYDGQCIYYRGVPIPVLIEFEKMRKK